MALAPSAAPAQGAVRLGMVGEFSGPFAQHGQQILGGMKAYMKGNGDTVAGKKIEIIQKDTTGPSPDVAKRQAIAFMKGYEERGLMQAGIKSLSLQRLPVFAVPVSPPIV